MAESSVQVGLIPERARGLARQVARTIIHMLAAIRIRDRHPGVEEIIAKAWIERVVMLRSDREHRLDHCVGIIPAARLSGSGLGNVKADIHAIARTVSARQPDVDRPRCPRGAACCYRPAFVDANESFKARILACTIIS